MSRERRVKVFRHGRHQAVRIPREFEFTGEKVFLRKEGERLIIEPARRKSLVELFDTWEPINEEFPPIPDPPPELFDL